MLPDQSVFQEKPVASWPLPVFVSEYRCELMDFNILDVFHLLSHLLFGCSKSSRICGFGQQARLQAGSCVLLTRPCQF